MDAIGAVIQAIMFFFGIWEEHKVTKEFCEQILAAGMIPYPVADADMDKLKQCREMQQEQEEGNND